MKQPILVKITDFTTTPGARYKSDGPFSAEEFRGKFLLPAYENARQEDRKIVVDLNGAMGFATTFLEEAFGGLVRYTKDEEIYYSIMEIICDDDELVVDDCYRYMRLATNRLPTPPEPDYHEPIERHVSFFNECGEDDY